MCGITGIFHFDPSAPIDADLSRTLNAAIAHRGPDDDGFYVDGHVALGNRRLSIIGLDDGRQPIANEDRSVWTVFNGEIYNYPELRHELAARGHAFRTHTDTEVLVHLYEEEGDEFVNRLNGMFAIALWDERQQRLLLYRDRLGEKPLYYTIRPGRLLFASEIKALLRDPSVSRTLDPAALYDYLTFQYNARRQTIFQDVLRLRPGSMLEVTRDGVKERVYWQIPTEPGAVRTEDEYLHALRELLRDSVRRRLLSDVPLGAFLSGGLDSSTIVALMAQMTDRPVQTFAVGFKVGGGYDESPHAERAARFFGTDHRALVVDSLDVEDLLPKTIYHLDEPVADFAAIPTYLIARFARQHVKVVLTGEGADELFAGYGHYRFANLLRHYERLPDGLRGVLGGIGQFVAPAKIARALRAGTLDPAAGYAVIKGAFTREELDALLTSEVKAELGPKAERTELEALFQRGRGLDPLNRYLLADLSGWLPEDLLMQVDKMTMSVGLEARVPFLDHRIVELLASMPSALKWRSGGKYLLRRACAGLVPDEIINRPKHGFTLPLERWLRAELKEMASELLLGPRVRARGLFHPPTLERVWTAFLAGTPRAFMQTWLLMNFELWCRVFLDGGHEEWARAAMPA
jgi:asparagine synthase (glutamine-hydrolysing)